MAGLNYGSKYHMKKQVPPEGVVWSSHIKKWLVRAKIKTKDYDGKEQTRLVTLAAFLTQEEAEDFYKANTN